MRDTINSILTKKLRLKELYKSVQKALKADTGYSDLLNDLKADREVLANAKATLIQADPRLAEDAQAIQLLKGEIKALNQSLASLVRPQLGTDPAQLSLFESLDIRISVK